jgi:hypothetical protein
MIKEKGNTCVSMIIPTHRFGQDRQEDPKEVQKAVLSAKQLIPGEQTKILKAIDELVEQIDFNRNKDAIGIFVSPDFKKLVKFPFPCAKKISVGESLLLSDLLYLENYSTPYYLLDISKKEIHLFFGVMDHLEEIHNKNFPKIITDDYEYDKPSQSGSNAGYSHVKSFEKDKTELQHIRLKKVFNEVDKHLQEYLISKDVPLIVCGPERDISLFKSVTNHLDNIASSISDNQQRTNMRDKEASAWLQIKSFIDQQKMKLIEEFKEKIGARLAVYGVEEVWEAAQEGKGFKLLVEKDYSRMAFVTENGKLYKHHPVEKHVMYPDVINEIISTVLEKNGKVIVVEKNALIDQERLALINRY